MSKGYLINYSWPENLITIHLTFCHPRLVKGYCINPFMARAPDDNSFDPLPSKNISKFDKLTHSWPMHLDINRLIFCNPGNVKGYLSNPFMARAPDGHSFNPLPTRNLLKVVK